MKTAIKSFIASLVITPFLAHAAAIAVTNETPWPITAMLGNNPTKQLIQPNEVYNFSEKRVAADCEYAEHRCNLQLTSNGLTHNGTLGTVVFDSNIGVVDIKNIPAGEPISFWHDSFNVSVKWFGKLQK